MLKTTITLINLILFAFTMLVFVRAAQYHVRSLETLAEIKNINYQIKKLTTPLKPPTKMRILPVDESIECKEGDFLYIDKHWYICE